MTYIALGIYLTLGMLIGLRITQRNADCGLEPFERFLVGVGAFMVWPVVLVASLDYWYEQRKYERSQKDD